MKLYLHIFFFFTLLSLTASGQGFRVRHYLPAAVTNVSRAIFETAPGNYFAAGLTTENTNGTSSNKLCIMGLGSQGQILWTKKYGNSKFEYLNNNLLLRSFFKSDNYIYHACSVRDSNNKYIGVLIKFATNGDTLWQRIFRDFDPLEDVIPQMVAKSVDGGFLVTGFFQNNSGNPYQKCMLIKTDGNGNETNLENK